MRKGFTILELLVASLLMGMLMTILTMIFNQSSISWRVGEASIADLDDVSEGIASAHTVADNLYVWGGGSDATAFRLTSLWDENGDLLQVRPLETTVDGSQQILKNKFSTIGSAVKNSLSSHKPGSWGSESVGSDQTDGGANTYTVNVKSAGPNRIFNDYDDIWSFPDEFN